MERKIPFLSFLLSCDCEPEAQFSRFMFIASTAQQVQLEVQAADEDVHRLHHGKVTISTQC